MRKLFTTTLFCFSIITASFSQTVLLKDINPSDGSYPSYFYEFNGAFYFFADNGTGTEIWKSDGSASGTQMLKDINPNSSSDKDAPYFTIYNGELYFSANNGTNGSELWKTNGTAQGTVRVSDINTSGDSYPRTLVVFNSELYFTANNGIGNYLYKTNGSNVTKVSDVQVQSGGEGDMIVFNDELYFGGIDITAKGLYKTNGTVGVETFIKEINSNNDVVAYAFQEHNSGLIFIANGPDGYELWKSDGTTSGTMLMKDINPTGNAYPSRLTLFNGEYYFSANNGVNGIQLWKTDGTNEGTVRLKNIEMYSKPEFKIFNSQLFFAANDGANGYELWKSDGTSNGTVMVKNIHPSDGSYPVDFAVLGNQMYFGADGGNTGAEVWKSDGTASGTVLVQDIYEGANSSDPTWFFVFNNSIFFGADDGVNGNELWKISGSTSAILDEESRLIKVFPNPTNDFVEIDLSKVNDLKDAVLFNSLNQEVKRISVFGNSNFRMNMQEVSSGIYHLVLTDKEGNLLIKKIVKN